MISVSPAIKEDYPAVGKLIKDFFTCNKFTDLEIEPDIDFSIKLAEQLADKHIELVLKVDNEIVGGLAGTVIPFWFNPEIKMFQEVYFYVKKGYRKYSHLLLDELTVICKAIGVNRIIMAHPNDGNLDRVEESYRSRGFKKLETHFIRRV